MKRYIILLLLIVVGSHSQTTYVPVNHWVYEFLERLETQRILPIVLSASKPMTRSEIAEYLAPLYAADSLTNMLSRTQKQQLDYLRIEFYEELARLGGNRQRPHTNLDKTVQHKWIDPWLPDFVYGNGRNFYSVDSPPFQLFFDPIIKRQRSWTTADSLSATEKVFENSNGLRLRGSVGRMGFLIDVRDHQEWGTRHYPGIVNYTKERLGFVRGNAKGLDHDETNAYLLYQYKYFTIAFGKDVNRWGPGYSGQLALSDYATSYDQLKFTIANQRIRFTSLTAVLQHYTDKFFDNGHQEKYLAGHRLEFAPLTWLNVGLHETIIYGSRKFEAAYLNPVMFYRSAEHYLGDRDNATMGLDFEILGLAKSKFYGELFIDDISISKLYEDFYGNKYAYLIGAYHVNLFKVSNWDIRLEYTRIRPFTYNHSGNTGYWHYSTLLGHWVGPNADNFMLESIYRISQPLFFNVGYERMRHGANPPGLNVGGDAFQLFNPDHDPSYGKFLDGFLHSFYRFKLFVSYEMLRGIFIQFEGQLGKYQNEISELDYVQGTSSSLTFAFKINY